MPRAKKVHNENTARLDAGREIMNQARAQLALGGSNPVPGIQVRQEVDFVPMVAGIAVAVLGHDLDNPLTQDEIEEVTANLAQSFRAMFEEYSANINPLDSDEDSDEDWDDEDDDEDDE